MQKHCAAGNVFGDQQAFPSRTIFGACEFGPGCTFGNDCTFGERCVFGEGCKFDGGCWLDSGDWFGQRCTFEAGCDRPLFVPRLIAVTSQPAQKPRGAPVSTMQTAAVPPHVSVPS